MMWHSSKGRCAALRNRRSSVMVLFALSLVVLIALVGLGVDVGICYIAKARMSKAADAAAIVVTRYLGRPTAELQRLALQAYRRNDPYGNLNPATDVTVTYTYGASGLPIKMNVHVQCDYQQPVSFIRVLGFRHCNLAADAEAVRFPIAMAVIIDRSGSMTGNGGSTTIPATMPQFLQNFVPGFDTVGIYSYSWTPVRELGFSTNFLGTPMQNLFNSSVNRIKFAGNTAPSDCIRMALQDMEQITAYNERGVKKIIVFMTDGMFNTFRTRPPNIMGAFSNAPPGKTAAWWAQNYLSDDGKYSSTSQWGSDGSGQDPRRSQSGPSYNFSGQGGGFTYIKTNTTGNGVFFRNLDAVVGQASGNDVNYTLGFFGVGVTQSFVYTHPTSGSYTNKYTIPGKLNSTSGYGQDWGKRILDNDNNASIMTINSQFRYTDSDIANDSLNAIARFKADFRFLSSVDGVYKKLQGDYIRAEAAQHAVRYCNAARKKRTDPNRITIFCIGFGDDSQLDVPVLMKMANLDSSDRNPPYTPLDSTEPYDDAFGFTLARDAAALNRTYVALGIYLATRLTK